ncbi:MAG: hypothetical protein AVDCRST_MAG79-1124, partial [uncultured Thermoleophilia bacterium]
TRRGARPGPCPAGNPDRQPHLAPPGNRGPPGTGVGRPGAAGGRHAGARLGARLGRGVRRRGAALGGGGLGGGVAGGRHRRRRAGHGGDPAGLRADPLARPRPRRGLRRARRPAL